MSIPYLWKTKFSKISKFLLIFAIITAWIFSGWPRIWQNPPIPPEIKEAYALNKVNNPHFPSDATSWTTVTTGAGTNVCGDNLTATETTAPTAFAWDSTGNPGGSFRMTGSAGNNNINRRQITQSITTPAGDVKVKGRFDYSTSGTNWRTLTANSSWIRLDIYDSANSAFVANLACVGFTSNISWTSTAFSSNVSLGGSTTYTIRVTMRTYNSNTGGSNSLYIDNIIINFAPTGLAVTAPADTINAQLDWTASTPGTGADGLHATTPYKVYRDTSSPVSTFLANATTNSYTDTSTTGNTTYYYAISDVDTASIESPLSAEVSILTRPGAPGTPTFTNVLATTLTVNWTAPTGGASSYKIERCVGSGCTPSQIASGVTDLFYNNSGLTANTFYRYRIRATNATSADGAYSGIGEVTTAGFSTAISIVRKAVDTAVTTITFPEGAPISTSSAPYNNIDGTGDPQFLDSSASEPVVRLKNTSAGTLKVWLEITTWSNGVAASEDYELVNTASTTIAAVTQVLSADGNAATVNTNVTIAADTYNALYLELNLSSLAGKTGTSTLTILGEAL